MKRLITITVTFLFAAASISGCDTRQSDWEQAQQADSIAAYQDFLAQYPDGEHADTARQQIAQIRQRDAWEEARAADSSSGYRSFVDQYPDSEYADEANVRIRDLERVETWERLQASRDITELESFARRYPDSAEAQLARAQIEQLEAAFQAEAEARARAEAEAQAQAEAEAEARAEEQAQAADGGYRVQLAAFRSEDQANAESARLETRFASLLQGTRIEIMPPDQSSSFFRLRTSLLAAEGAQNLCNKLKEQGQDCLVFNE